MMSSISYSNPGSLVVFAVPTRFLLCSATAKHMVYCAHLSCAHDILVKCRLSAEARDTITLKKVRILPGLVAFPPPP